MRKFLLFAGIAFFFLSSPAFAKEDSTAMAKVRNCMVRYIQVSSLGPGYSGEMAQEYIDEFLSLFEMDAFLFWDIQIKKDTVLPPQSIYEYIDNAKKLYAPKQPVLNYDAPKILLSDDLKTAVVYLTKFHILTDSLNKAYKKNTYKLKFRLNLYASGAKIQSIEQDKRNTRVRSIFLVGGYTFYNNVSSFLIGSPESAAIPAPAGSFTCSISPAWFAGAGLDIRFNKDKFDGLLFETGLYYSASRITFNIGPYENKTRQVLDAGSANPFEVTVFDRSQAVTEVLQTYNIALPLAIKYYFNSYLYVRGGVTINYMMGTLKADYSLSHTGGDTAVNLTTGNSVYIPPDKELSGSWGFFRDSTYQYSGTPDIKLLYFTLVTGVGFEKKFNKWSIGIEPSLFVGQNPLSSSGASGAYDLYSKDNYQSFIQTMDLPGYILSGNITLRVSMYNK